ncbi:hypothetical protein ACNKHS_14910 [Shigella flexneri]
MRAGQCRLPPHAGGAAGVIGALLAHMMRGLENDVYFRVGPPYRHRAVGEKRHLDCSIC